MTDAGTEDLLRRGVLVCVGPGGVGKTTVSAILGLLAARAGKKAVCVTVDPSERLAESLGLHRRPSPFRRVSCDGGADTIDDKIHRADAGLDAIILHGSWVIDRAFARYIPADKWDVIRGGRIYPYMRHTLRGLHELASMVLVNDLVTMRRWDIVIVDTAPSAHAVDFLEMPERIIQAIRSPAVGILMGAAAAPVPGRRFIGKASSLILRSIGKMIGLDFLAEISEFLTLNRESLENLCRAAEAIRVELLSGSACIVQVTSPAPQAIDESLLLHKKIARQGLRSEAFIINRVLPFGADVGTGPLSLPGDDGGEALRAKLERNAREMAAVALREHGEIQRLVDNTPPGRTYLRIPMLDEDVHDVPVLKKLLDEITAVKTAPACPGVVQGRL